ncbi:response regulator transcription factor [Leptolyngbya sp. NIES-2104]|uniref:response regulator transcription factor n=1 Tax=Leptolyngbya sp. NIES-2104 TaxID=1552121 RepID=UPI0006ECAA5C|nr:response regulator transcription factor [Leptolyngbya sp. NIES-2104]GAP96230.1 response regulator containing a CheY-like receiver domain and an HTH DNA-binding domain [Leptolyngbya sp. NIES-2104]
MPHSTLASTLSILVIDDHPLVLDATVMMLKSKYPQADLIPAQTAADALIKIESLKPNVAIVDLSIPETIGQPSRVETGIQLLKQLMERYPTLNIVVQTADARPLIRVKAKIKEHQAGFTVADKSLSSQEMLSRVEWAIQGVFVTPKEIRSGLELKSDWLTLLKLGFVDGLTDHEIAARMNVAERTVRHYWTKLQDALEIYPEEGKNIRTQTGIRAREEGLLD